MNLWIVGQTIDENQAGQVWDFAGVFDSAEAAQAACLDESYFIGPCILNESLPEEAELWPGCYRMGAATQ